MISGNSYAGIQTDGGSSGTVVQGNFIGSDLTGMVAIGNTQIGIRSGGTADVIGGATNDGQGNPSPGAAPGNLVSGSDADISLVGPGAVVAGNLVGLNATGTAPLDPGVGSGVSVSAGGSTIGGMSANDRNVITGGFYELGIGAVGDTRF